jgi:hypothetical protein
MSDAVIHLDLPVRPTPVTAFVTPRERPEAYPGTRPAWSFLFTGDEVRPLEALPGGDLRAVLAVGSNACPRRLADPDKFGGRSGVAIPVVRGWVEGVVSVYLGWAASYGSIPATVAGCPGARSRLWATLLMDDELTRLNESEGVGDGYELIGIPETDMATDLGPIRGPLLAYWDRRGLGDPATGGLVRLDCFEAEGTELTAMDQREAMRACAAAAGDTIDVPRPGGRR